MTKTNLNLSWDQVHNTLWAGSLDGHALPTYRVWNTALGYEVHVINNGLLGIRTTLQQAQRLAEANSHRYID
jgi:hypothetical protein